MNRIRRLAARIIAALNHCEQHTEWTGHSDGHGWAAEMYAAEQALYDAAFEAIAINYNRPADPIRRDPVDDHAARVIRDLFRDEKKGR